MSLAHLMYGKPASLPTDATELAMRVDRLEREAGASALRENALRARLDKVEREARKARNPKRTTREAA